MPHNACNWPVSICRITFCHRIGVTAEVQAIQQVFGRPDDVAFGIDEGGAGRPPQLVAVFRLELQLEIERLVARRERHRHRPGTTVEERKARVQPGCGRLTRQSRHLGNRSRLGWLGEAGRLSLQDIPASSTKATHAEMPTIPLVLMAKTSMNADRRGEHTCISLACADQPPFV